MGKRATSKKVIILCHEPTEWCSPTFFVVKPDGKNVRMVTDFTFVERPMHPFASVSDIFIKKIPATANDFAKMDSVNGYFQIAQNNLPASKRKVQVSGGPEFRAK